MKKTFFLEAVLASFLMAFWVAPTVMAYTIQIGSGGSYGPYQVGDGGEFTVTPDAGLSPVLSSYVDNGTIKTKNIGAVGTFQTFCLELNEPIYAGHTYTANINPDNRAVNGGLRPSKGGDPISKGTAYLYHQFQSGTLEDYNYTGNRWATAAALQNMIWWLEDEQYGYGWHNPFVEALQDEFGINWKIAAQLDNDAQYPVSVLNLWVPGHEAEPGYRRQDLLVCDPVPEPATMVLLGSGLIALAGLARKRFKK